MAGKRQALQCHAKSKRSGKRCRRWAIIGKKVCYMHGGAKGTGSKPGNTKRMVHGIYSRRITKADKDQWESIPLGTLDDELRIARTQLARAIEYDSRFDQVDKSDPEAVKKALQIDEIEQTRTAGGRKGSRIKRVAINHSQRINQLLRIIGDLEIKREQLINGEGGDPDDHNERFARLAERFTDLAETLSRRPGGPGKVAGKGKTPPDTTD